MRRIILVAVAAISYGGSAFSCPLIDARYLFNQNPAISMNFERISQGRPHGSSLLGVYVILNRGSQKFHFAFGGATNGDLLIMKGFDAAIVVEFSYPDGRPYRGDSTKRAASRLVTRDPEGPEMGVPTGRWTLRCKR